MFPAATRTLEPASVTHKFEPTVRVFEVMALVPIETFPYASREFPVFVKSIVFEVEFPKFVTSVSLV
jgi:hypothetical protein